MTIRYSNTRGDLLLANFRTLLYNRFLLAFWSIAIAGICYSALREAKQIDQSIAYKITFCAIMAVLYYALFLGLTLVVVSCMILSKKNKGVLGEHTLSISDEGVIESTVYNESLSRWSVYHKTVSTKSYLMLYVSEGRFHFVSKKRPLIEGDLAGFEAVLNEKTKRA